MRFPRSIVAALAAVAVLAVGVQPALAHGGKREARGEQIAVGGCVKPKQRAAKATCAKPKLMKAAAEFLGMTKAELREALAGTSLAKLAEEQGKSVADLKAALLAPAQARLERAVANERITRERADAALERLEACVDRLVAKEFPAG
jgi:lambda repressor-like predicted transcriptional regulator